jgi:predicted AAA+ superfamily ATPase
MVESDQHHRSKTINAPLMSSRPYIPRVVDAELKRRLAAAGAVLVEGPKGCGKTSTALQAAASHVFLDVDTSAREAAALDPSLILAGDVPRLIDEWHVETKLWDHVRRAVDERGIPGQFILAGSARPQDDITRHTGAARILRMRMRPMTLWESGHSTGDLSLDDLLNGDQVRAVDSGNSVPEIVDRVCTGGWPAFQQLSVASALLANSGYVDEIARTDISALDGVSRDPQRVARLMRSLARHTAASATLQTIATDTAEPGEDSQLALNTAKNYMGALERLMILEPQRAWAPHLRSRTRTHVKNTWHLVDPSLAVAALGASPATLLKDLNLFGFLFESIVIRDLRVFAQNIDAEVLHYRDDKKLEVDAIVAGRDGRWAAFEVKLGGAANIDAAAATLLAFKNKIDTAKCGDPARLAVITATGYGYVRPDGVAVLPITSLRP